MKIKAALHNLGCKVNAYETDAMKEQLEEHGYDIVAFEERADVYIINTCSVTNIADRKSRQMLHRAKKKNPDAVVVAVGCYVQAVGEELKKDEAVDLIIGNNKKGELVSLLEEFMADKEKNSGLVDIAHTKEYEELRVKKTGGHTRAFIKVQDGCNQFCSYCIIPYTRGRVRSRLLEDVADEVEGLAAAGYKEVVLTGIHLSSYGSDLEGDIHLLTLIKRLAQIEQLKRIRLGSLEPGIITEEFVKELVQTDKFCPHFHLSLQSGCDRTLKRMNRHYTTREYKERCDLLRKYFIHPAITTDVIAGFAGETEEEFRTTLQFVGDVEFYEMHVFKYSKRKGTKAASMPDQVPEEEKTVRSHELMEKEKEMSERFRYYYVGKTIEILTEEPIEYEGGHYMTGYTKEYVRAAIKGDYPSNCFVSGKAIGFLTKDILLIEE